VALCVLVIIVVVITIVNYLCSLAVVDTIKSKWEMIGYDNVEDDETGSNLTNLPAKTLNSAFTHTAVFQNKQK
jgi:hypothetical protein